MLKINYVEVCYSPASIVGDSTAYSSIWTAYGAASDEVTDTIRLRDLTFEETLDLNGSKSVTIQGGYDCHHTTNTGMTTITGDLTISGGTVTMENVVVE